MDPKNRVAVSDRELIAAHRTRRARVAVGDIAARICPERYQAGATRAGRIDHAERHRAGTRLHQKRIRVTVIATLELDDAIAPGECTREPDRAHCGLGPGTHEADSLH